MIFSEIETMIREEAARLDLFDASSWLGRSTAFPLMETGTPELLRSVHANAQITGAFISHWSGYSDCSQDGNLRLIEAQDGEEEWYAVLAVNPTYPADPGSPGTGDWAWPERTRGVRVFPATGKYPLTSWCVGPLCKMLLDRGLPMFVFHSELDLRDLHELASAFASLAIVVESHPKKIMYDTRGLLPLMRECPNIRLEISNVCTQGTIEYVVETLGPERLIFGTFAPACDPLVPIGMLVQADISKDAKRLIAGENIRRILREVRL